jgi:hypothetical protein
VTRRLRPPDLARTRVASLPDDPELRRAMASLMVRPTIAPPGAPRRPFESTGTAMSLLPPWADGVAALTRVVQRQAAMIFRRELSDADATDPAIEAVRDRVRQGQPLSDAVRRDLEARLGADLRYVRIHTDAIAARAADALHASAFTLGDDMFFACGAFAPSEDAGQRLLVHELTHVHAQQGRVPASRLSRPDDPLEQEAAAYDRTSPAPAESLAHAEHAPGPAAAASNTLLRAPDKRARTASLLSLDDELMRGFMTGFVFAAGAGFTAEARAKIERDFRDPRRLVAIYFGLQCGVLEGALDDLWDNINGLVQLASWLAMSGPVTPVVGPLSFADLKDRYEALTDPAGKAARDKANEDRRRATIEGLAQLAAQLAKDPGIVGARGAGGGGGAGAPAAHL